MLFDRKHNLVSRNLAEYGDLASPLTVRYGINNGHRIVLYAGTFEAYQGLDLLVDASPTVVQRCENVHFVCLGGNPNQVANIKARARRHGVAEYFVLPGTVPPEDIEPHFRIASLLVSPRVAGTNTPLKIYAYLRSGVPILATNIPSHTQVLTPEVALLVGPSSDELAAGIVRLLDDPELSRRLAANALRLAKESYSPEAYYRKVAEAFSFLAARCQTGNTLDGATGD